MLFKGIVARLESTVSSKVIYKCQNRIMIPKDQHSVHYNDGHIQVDYVKRLFV